MENSDKQLRSKAVNIKGKAYVQVSDRIVYFNEEYPNGMIQTDIYRWEGASITCVAKVTPDAEKPDRFFTGYAQEVIGEGMVNKTAALENAETSAVGRALGMMGIGVIESIASVDEINKAQNAAKQERQLASHEQLRKLRDLMLEAERLEVKDDKGEPVTRKTILASLGAKREEELDFKTVKALNTKLAKKVKEAEDNPPF